MTVVYIEPGSVRFGSLAPAAEESQRLRQANREPNRFGCTVRNAGRWKRTAKRTGSDNGSDTLFHEGNRCRSGFPTLKVSGFVHFIRTASEPLHRTAALIRTAGYHPPKGGGNGTRFGSTGHSLGRKDPPTPLQKGAAISQSHGRSTGRPRIVGSGRCRGCGHECRDTISVRPAKSVGVGNWTLPPDSVSPRGVPPTLLFRPRFGHRPKLACPDGTGRELEVVSRVRS